ncbi:ferredoxin [Saccharopolyspora dendranthemae]|uniref:Ferredoxin n=1 Tax=Saccharopolyspora dendranthemae TaxID=1181886 RepID=A0A561V7X6_9PSEU|nr:ferredoxin [Saccharopolyspora dendranthemae]TWG07708.1 ferredoxin [Saccharopolyspora dendranthemae]
MSRIEADRTVCEGIGMCEAQAHEYFEVGDEGSVDVLAEHVPEGDRAFVRAAVESCPVSALRLVD